MMIEGSNNTAHLINANQIEDPSQHVRQEPTTAFHTPFNRDRHQYSAPVGTPFASPPTSVSTIRNKRQNRSEAAARQPNQHGYLKLTTDVGSPFLSPPLTANRAYVTKRRNNNITDPRKARPEPLVLDPSDRTSARRLSTEFITCSSDHRRVPQSSTSSIRSSFSSIKKSSHNDIIGSNSTLPVVKKLFQVAAQGFREHHATAAQYSTDNLSNTLVDGRGYLHTTPAAIDPYGTTACSAAFLARSKSVVQAGFLQKMGENIPEFKRRFFVLKPETNLYYYLSPNETEPRGKIDLERSSVEQVEETPDGRFRFIIVWNNHEDDTDSYNNTEGDNQQNIRRRIVLEARSKDIGEQWIRCMKGERVSSLKARVENLNSTTTEQDNRIADLELQLQHFRMIEADRDGALEDARNWKKKFNQLDEALRLLTQQIRKPPPAFKDEDQIVTVEKKEEENDGDHTSSDHPKRSSSNENTSTPTKSNRALLLDDLSQEDMNVEEILKVPGIYFSALSNACQQQRESLRLASVEASTAVEDVIEANERAGAVQKRIHKAEKHILKLWEENCTIRKILKQNKREKRVLVKEVKQLQRTLKDLNETRQLSKAYPSYNKASNEDGQISDTMIGSDDERLIIELEEHVASSIRLHEQMIAGTEIDNENENDGTISVGQSIFTNPASTGFDVIDVVPDGVRTRFKVASSSQHTDSCTSNTIQTETSKPKLLSLLDDDSDSDSGRNRKEEEINGRDPQTDMCSIVRGVETEECIGSGSNLVSLSPIDVTGSSPKRFNLLLKLYESDDDEHHHNHNDDKESNRILYTTSKLITENGQATSQLICPLVDVVETDGYPGVHQSCELNEELRVYHLTFYTTKIGLQFQKASPAPMKPRGLLTDALTDDLVDEENSSSKTAAELRRVASISSLAAGGINSQGRETCPLALPEDIVLVFGFDGFDNSGVNRRPKLGARLVAFDGVSVEVGKWTFESIRKSIKSRGRPLTLSFRNDFLTTEQRTILTKAIKEVDTKQLPTRSIIQYERPQSTTPSLNSALSHESDHFLNNMYGVHRHDDPKLDILDTSTAATEGSNCWVRRCPTSSSNSISSIYKENYSIRPSSSSVSTHKSSNLYSFSEAGSVSSSLITNILKRVSSEQEELHKYEEERRFGVGINPAGTPQHQDFQSNLL